MEKNVSILYANRNRDAQRIRRSLESLAKQVDQSVEVVFVDYGSNPDLVGQYENLIKDFSFVQFFALEVQQLLWNKSKALNFGIRQAKNPFIFIADVDLIFHPESLPLFKKLASLETFYLFKLGYLDREESKKLKGNYQFKQLKPMRSGSVNGMVLAAKQALVNVSGLDEFFHFYGAEDEDLFSRLEAAGYRREAVDSIYFYHNWHLTFSGSEDRLLTGKPRVQNIMRINQRHFQRNADLGMMKPKGQYKMGEIISPERVDVLKNPTRHVLVENILAHVEHFLNEELTRCKGEVIRVEFLESAYFRSWKYKIKKLLGKQSQPYIPMKEVNDRVLKTILFRYRDGNYSFQISSDLRRIIFIVEL